MKLYDISTTYQKNDGPMKDYRVIGNNNPFKDIHIKKKDLQETLESDHKNVKSHYKLINRIDSEYNPKFAKIYGERCAYCGIDYDIKDHKSFVVDHFICKASGGDDHINNLVYACKYCNDKKSHFKIPEEDFKILNPDQELGKTFYRDEMFYIKISETYINNDSVKNFYIKMSFDYDRRRIEYLILAINKLLSTIQNKDKEHHLLKILKKLMNKYNRRSLVENIKKIHK